MSINKIYKIIHKMTTWRALMSPSRNVSLLESNKDSIDNRIQT